MADSVQAGNLVGQRLGKYDLLALLAIGGTAEIYLARIGGEAGFEKYVVVKCLLDHLADDAEFVRMFLDEARLGAQLDHSNIVQTLELGEHEGRYFMVMEYLAGMSLAQLARKTQERVASGLMPIDLVLGLGAQACAGLHYAHERSAASGQQLNIVHRDVSPQNLVVSFDGVLKIVDFGIAKADVRQTHTRSGTIKGKFAYMSPEQCLAKKIDRRTDIFALGVIMHELLTARRLFKRSTTYETYQTIVNGKVPTPSSVNNKLDSSLDEVVMRALKYERQDRYPTAEAFGEALLSVLHTRGHSVSASDIARYYDEYFVQELQEHADRMRALISGREKSATEDLTWDSQEREDSRKNDLKDEGEELDASDPDLLIDTKVREPSHTDVEEVEDEQPDELEGEATRIELNPLEHVESAARSAGTSDRTIDSAAPGRSGAKPPPGAGEVTAPTQQVSRDQDRPTIALGPARDPSAQPGSTGQARGRPGLGRVPDLGPLERPGTIPPAGKSGNKPTLVPNSMARPRGHGSTHEEPTRANRTPTVAPVAAAASPQAGPKKTLFAPGGAPLYRPGPPGPERSRSDRSPLPGKPGAAPVIGGGDPRTPRGAPDAPGGSEGEKASNGTGDAKATPPTNSPFGPPPSLTGTDSGRSEPAAERPRPISVPPDTLPGQDDPTGATTDPAARPATQGGGPEHPRPPVPRAKTPPPVAGNPTPAPMEPPRLESSGAKFPPVSTPAAFKPAPQRVLTPGGVPAVGSDLARLAGEKDHRRPLWLLVTVFVAAVGVGMGLTLLLAGLF